MKKTSVKKISIKLITLLIICLIGFMVYPADIKADTKEYSVLSAEFDVTLLENCDAEITEVWQVRFEKGSFSRFYREFYTDVEEIEKFDSVEIKEVSINGVSCMSSTGANNRTDNTYWFENGSEKYLAWFKSSKNETVEYKATYVLHNVVKQVDTGNAVFVYRFIGANFDKPVSSVKTTITGPAGTGAVVGYAGKSEYTVKDNTVVFSGKRSKSEVLKYNVHFPGSAFESNGKVLSADAEKAGEKSSKSESDEGSKGTWVCCSLYIVIFLACVLIPSFFSMERKARKLLKKDPDYCKKRAADFKQAGINPLVYYKWFGKTHKENMIWSELIMQLTLMLSAGKISLENGTIIFETAKLDNFDRAVLEWFKQNCQYNDEGAVCAVYPNDFEWLVYNSPASDNLFVLFESFINQNYNQAVAAVNMTSLDKAAFDKFFKQKGSYYSAPAFKYFQYADIGGSVDYMMLMYMAYSYKLDFSTDGVEEKYYGSFSHMGGYYTTYDNSYIAAHKGNSSDSGCSSCSSCSSCGGCGGGGAD